MNRRQFIKTFVMPLSVLLSGLIDDVRFYNRVVIP